MHVYNNRPNDYSTALGSTIGLHEHKKLGHQRKVKNIDGIREMDSKSVARSYQIRMRVWIAIMHIYVYICTAKWQIKNYRSIDFLDGLC